MKLTRRGEIVLAVLLAVAGVEIILAAYWLLDHVNYIQGVGYCFRSSSECYGFEG